MQFFAGEAPAVPDPSGVLDLGSLMPPWVQNISIVGILVLIVMAFMRDWVITKSRHDRELASRDEIASIYKKAAEDSNANVDKLSNGLTPVLAQNEAMLKAISEIQEEQRRYREERGQRR